MIRLAAIAVLFVFCISACRPGPIARLKADSIPIESVDVETNGKKAGGTHFRISSEELFLDYEYFDQVEHASTKLEEKASSAKQILDRSKVLDSENKTVGSVITAEFASAPPNERFCLIWTNTNKFTQVCSGSVQAISEFRNTYEL